jgi:mannose-6-phosphate isomerase-like protein (cupin superfamily)
MKNNNRLFVSKGWGYEDWIANTPLYCGKDLFLKKDKKLSLHYHKLKDETFLITSGKVCVTYYDEDELDELFPVWHRTLFPWINNERPQYNLISSPVRSEIPEILHVQQIVLDVGDSFHIPIGRRHTLYGLLDSHIIEFSTEHFDEDSYRILRGD